MADLDEEGLPFLNGKARTIVQRRCDGIHLNLMRLIDMVGKERDVAGMGRRHGVRLELRQIVEDSLEDLPSR